MADDQQAKKITKLEKDLEQLKKIANMLNTKVSNLIVDNNRLKHQVHKQTNDIAALQRKQ